MKIKICTESLLAVMILFSVFAFTACPAPTYDYVIINNSAEAIEIEYEFIVPEVKHDKSELTSPVTMRMEEYKDGEGADKQWNKLIIDQDYSLETSKEPYSANSADGREKRIISTKSI